MLSLASENSTVCNDILFLKLAPLKLFLLMVSALTICINDATDARKLQLLQQPDYSSKLSASKQMWKQQSF